MRKLMMFVVFIFIVGCSGGSTVYEPEVYVGSDGVVMTFVDSPQKEVIEQQDFPLNVELHNKGAHDVSNGALSLIVEDDYVEVEGWDGISSTSTKFSTFDLEGKSSFNVQGDKDFGTIMLKAKELESMTETHTVLVGLNLCYDYATYFSGEVCIDSDVYNTKNTEKVCEAKTITSSGQGAPVAVSEVEIIMYTKNGNLQPRFKVTVSNLANGEIFKSGKSQAACSSTGLSSDDLNVVDVNKAMLSTNTLTCSPNPVIIREGKGVTVCDLESPLTLQTTNYVTLLHIELGYGYTETKTEGVEIRRLVGSSS